MVYNLRGSKYRHLQLVDKLDTAHFALPHGLETLQDALKTLAADLHRVDGQLLLGEETLGNAKGLLREVVVDGVGREVEAELVEGFAERCVCEDLLSLAMFLTCEYMDYIKHLPSCSQRLNGCAGSSGDRQPFRPWTRWRRSRFLGRHPR